MFFKCWKSIVKDSCTLNISTAVFSLIYKNAKWENNLQKEYTNRKNKLLYFFSLKYMMSAVLKVYSQLHYLFLWIYSNVIVKFGSSLKQITVAAFTFMQFRASHWRHRVYICQTQCLRTGNWHSYDRQTLYISKNFMLIIAYS